MSLPFFFFRFYRMHFLTRQIIGISREISSQNVDFNAEMVIKNRNLL